MKQKIKETNSTKQFVEKFSQPFPIMCLAPSITIPTRKKKENKQRNFAVNPKKLQDLVLLVFLTFFLEPMKPAIPPAIAIKTSQIVGEVRAINSLLA